mmetsp:Transcript_157368/g.504837  ORF Transcript_157368/g.504837 Transcript_157368/m.504837 type:complete len:754 (-) Transcript_157368:471-2732(-)
MEAYQAVAFVTAGVAPSAASPPVQLGRHQSSPTQPLQLHATSAPGGQTSSQAAGGGFVLGAAGVACFRAAGRRKKRTARKVKVQRAAAVGNAWPLSPEDKKTLRQVLIVHRHGTRFPTKPSGAGNLSWPQRAHFWDKYKGHLTPVGGKQLEQSGAVLRERYIGEDGGLFKGVKQIDGRSLAVYTSNIQRTLQSAWSFLLGLVPDASIFFAFRSERVFSDGLRQSVGVPIYVEDATEGDDKLFHEWTIEPGYKKWVKENQGRSEFLAWASKDPDYIALLDKLYETTGERKLSPDKDPLKRLVGAKDVDTLVTIDESHKRPILPNEAGEPLLEREVHMLRKIGNEVKRCWFGDAQGDISRSYGMKGAGYLGHKIWRHMQERASEECHLRFIEFSCHDTTMSALATHLGIQINEIGFGAFFCFELHENEKGEHFVKFFYNKFPAKGASSYENLKCLELPLGRAERLLADEDCPEGAVTLEQFAHHCKIPDLEENFEKFMRLLGRADLGPTRSDLEALLEKGSRWLSFDEWKVMYDASFISHDQNGDGCLCKEEMMGAVKEWYGITGKTVDLVFHLVDREPETDALTEQDVYLAMCALVGMRGSISSKTLAGSVPAAEQFEPSLDGDIDARSAGGTTKLMAAANVSDLFRINELVKRGADVNAIDDYGWTALRYAARRKDFATATLLVELRADVNLASKSGRTPLMSAVANNAPDIVQLLIDHGADLSAKNRDGMTAKEIASRGGGMGSSVTRLLVN